MKWNLIRLAAPMIVRLNREAVPPPRIHGNCGGYRHLEGIGENIEIEFVDPSGSGEYHMTADPCEKDALAHVPSAGASLSEMLGQSTKAGRFSNTNGTTCPMPLAHIIREG